MSAFEEHEINYVYVSISVTKSILKKTDTTRICAGEEIQQVHRS